MVYWRMRFGLAISLALGAVSLATASFHFYQIPIPSGYVEEFANGVSYDGRVVVGDAQWNVYPAPNRAFKWIVGSGAMSWINPSQGGDSTYCMANGVSASGSVVVGYGNIAASGIQPLVWTPIDLLRLEGVAARAVSADGTQVVGETHTGAGPYDIQGFLWNAGDGYTYVGFLPGGGHSEARSISGRGDVVAVDAISPSSASSACRWTAISGLEELGSLGEDHNSQANCISEDGTVIVGASNVISAQHASRWTRKTGMVDLGVLTPGGCSHATSTNTDGNVVVGIASGPQSERGFVWTPQMGVFDLKQFLLDKGVSEVTSWHELMPNAISADGRTIVGYGTDPNGQSGAWAVTIDTIEPNAYPDSYSVIRGSQSGPSGVSGVISEDDYRLMLIGDGLDPSPCVDFVGESYVDAPSSLKLTVETSSSRLDMVEVVRMWNWSTGGWDGSASLFRAPSYTDLRGSISVGARAPEFVETGTRRLKCRLTVIPASDMAASDGWAYSIDQVVWTVGN